MMLHDFMELSSVFIPKNIEKVRLYILTLLVVHPCDKKNIGGCEHICNKKGSDVACTCKAGFKLADDKKSCIQSKCCLHSF